MATTKDRGEKLTKYRAMAGVIFIVLPTGIPWYYGNLATYNESYFRFKSDPNSGDVDSTWMLSAFFIGFISGQLMSGTIANTFGLARTFLVSNIVFDLGVFATYFSVQHSVGVTLLTLMAIPGLCSGVIFALSFAVVAAWFRGRHVGVASSFVTVAFSAGAVVYNEVVTAFVNPKNLAPDYTEGNMIFFSQPEVIDRYPSVFFMIGILSAAFQIIGTPLFKTPPPETHDNVDIDAASVCQKDGSDSLSRKEKDVLDSLSRNEKDGLDSLSRNEKDKSGPLLKNEKGIETSQISPQGHPLAQSRDTFDQTRYDTFHGLNESSNTTTSQHESNPATRYSDFSNQDKRNTDMTSNTTTSQHESNPATRYSDFSNQDKRNTDMTSNTTTPHDNSEPTTHDSDIKPAAVVQTVRFHVLWFASFAMAFGYLLVNNYYKLFGQLWIDDDNFLATTGSVSTITGAVMRIIAGVAVDRFGLKITTIGVTSAYIILLSFWYTSVRVNPWFYMVFTNILSGTVSCAFIVFPLGMLQYFGHRYYPTNIGLLLVSTLFANLIAPTLFPLFLGHFGWFWLFVSISVMGPFVVISQVLFMP